MAGVLEPVDRVLTRWSTSHNPFFAARHAGLLPLLPFAAMTLTLLLTGWELALGGKAG